MPGYSNDTVPEEPLAQSIVDNTHDEWRKLLDQLESRIAVAEDNLTGLRRQHAYLESALDCKLYSSDKEAHVGDGGRTLRG